MPKYKVSQDTSLQELVSSIATHVSGTGQFERFKRTYKNDRLAFVHDVTPELGETITPYQEAILGLFDSGINRIAVRGPHGLGKTWLAAVLVHHSVLTAEEDCKVPTTASAWRQLEKYLWPEIRKLAKYIAWPVVGRDPYDARSEFFKLSINLKSETNLPIEAFALASDDYTTLEGAHATRMSFVFDEAKTIPAPTWDAVEGAFSTEGLSDHEVLAFAISTPGPPAGRFYDIHTHRPGYEDWTAIHVTVEQVVEAGRMSWQWVRQRERQWGRESAVFQNRVLGEFADVSEDGVIPLSWVRMANQRWREWAQSGKPEPTGVRTLGVDVARYGTDSTVIAVRDGSILTKILDFPKNRTTTTAGIVTANSEGRVVNIEMDSYGSSVYDMLRENGVTGVRGMVPNGRTQLRDKTGMYGFSNQRTAMWWKMREALDPEQGSEVALPPHPQLIGDLTSPNYEIRSNGVIQLESKRKIKERLGRSPDYGDACCLAFFRVTSGGGIVF